MQWNTSCDESLVLYHLSSDSVYYTIFVNSAVTNPSGSFSASPASRSLRSGMKSILRAFANFAAVRNEKLTSWRSTLVMYGRETCIRLASSVWLMPSCFIRRSIRRRNADPILSIAFIDHSNQINLAQRRQHLPANEQPTHKRIQTPPVRSHNVQKYSPVRGHRKVGEWRS